MIHEQRVIVGIVRIYGMVDEFFLCSFVYDVPCVASDEICDVGLVVFRFRIVYVGDELVLFGCVIGGHQFEQIFDVCEHLWFLFLFSVGVCVVCVHWFYSLHGFCVEEFHLDGVVVGAHVMSWWFCEVIGEVSCADDFLSVDRPSRAVGEFCFHDSKLGVGGDVLFSGFQLNHDVIVYAVKFAVGVFLSVVERDGARSGVDVGLDGIYFGFVFLV